MELFKELGNIFDPMRIKPIEKDITDIIIREISEIGWQDFWVFAKKEAEVWPTLEINGKEYELHINFKISCDYKKEINGIDEPYIYDESYDIEKLECQLWYEGRESNIILNWNLNKIYESLE